ncbi:LysE family translocator [Inquilinus limosus]|uniref:Threonine transporter RhtB n=1 Tax=Inquilinus limosus TaxID=171674 RepID=A0A211ZMH1_9PROT|nr:LysE family transporter [Inquilinus limosus]OWJ66461.1 threonine transporter RhtB [Inquilinus limosus]
MDTSLADPGLWRPLAALFLAAAVVMGSPGPSTISLTAVGASFGIRRSLPYAVGLIAGTIAVLLAVAAGLVALVTAIPHGLLVLGVLSAIYILFLAWKIATAPPLGGRDAAARAPGVAGGFGLAVANPKAYFAIAAIFAGTTVIAGDSGLDAAVKIALLSLMIVLIHLAWLLAGVSLSRWLRDPVVARIINLAMAAALVAVTAAEFL